MTTLPATRQLPGAGRSRRSAGPRRWTLRAAVIVSLLAALGGLFAAPAFAHAELLATTPDNATVLTVSPPEVVLTFSEAVATSYGGGFRVAAPNGSAVTIGKATVVGTTVVSTLPPGLGVGSYLVSWRVVSDDGHPISGQFTFSVGHPSATVSVARTGGDPTTGIVFGALRFVGFAGMILLVGGLVFSVGIGRLIVRGRVWRLLAAGWLISAVGSALELLTYGPYASGRGLSAVTDGHLLNDDLGTTYGRAHMVRFAMLALIGAALVELRPQPKLAGPTTSPASTSPASTSPVPAGTVELREAQSPFPSWQVVSLLIATSMVFLGTWSVSGHAGAGTYRGFAVVNDALHLTAISTWLGGLIFLLAVGLRISNPDRDVVLQRWSRAAFGAVIVLVASGTYASFRQVRHLRNITSTPYGRLLLIKVCIVAVMVGFGALARWWVRQRRWSERTFHLGVFTEVGLSIAVLTLTAILVESAPARLGLPRRGPAPYPPVAQAPQSSYGTFGQPDHSP